MRRIAVVGTTGSGKTSLARLIARRLSVPHIELDALHWEPNWTEADTAVLQARVSEATAADAWVADGNYAKIRDLIWPRADTLVWLDYPLPVILWQLTRRTIGRLITREELWNENRESFRATFLSRDSLFLWVLQTHGRHRREYASLPRQPQYAHLRVVRLRSPAETRTWLTTLPEAPA